VDIQGYKFSFGSKIDAERDGNGQILTWAPKEKYYKDDRPLHASGSGPFATLSLGDVPDEIGVYAVLRNAQDVMFVGATKDSFAKRWGKAAGFTSISPSACFKGGEPTFCRVNHSILVELQSGKQMSLWIFPTQDPVSIKKGIIGAKLPPWNVNY